MRKFGALLGCLIVTAVICAPAGAAAPGIDSKGACSSINLGGPKVFYKQKMRCANAKHYARRLYKTDGRDEPRNFSCQSGSNFNQGAGCQHDFKNNRFFGWFPAD